MSSSLTVTGSFASLVRRSTSTSTRSTTITNFSTSSTTTHSSITRLASSNHVVRAKKLSSRTGRFDSRNRKGGLSIKEEVEEDVERESLSGDFSTVDSRDELSFDGKPMPVLPGDQPSFWEGEQWDGFGFFAQYLWAFSIIFALVACGVAVATYNEGASDFKATPAYQESIQSRELLQEPDVSGSEDVFESNPTEVAPSLE